MLPHLIDYTHTSSGEVAGYIEVPERPGLGVDLNIEEILKHPYQQENYIPLFKPGWERRGR